jgi:DNA-binding winged helix-turn-helix (wHTH) protein
MLLERPGEIVTREELQQKLWSNDTFVDFDNSLSKAINKIREALGDSADNPRFVETLARRGYRFIAPVDGTVTAAESPNPPAEVITPTSPRRRPAPLAIAGDQSLSLEEAIKARQHGVDPLFVKSLASLGYTGLSTGELIRARNHGVNPEFIQGLRHQGYDSVSLDDLIRLRNHGVTAEFIQRMQSEGFPRLSIEQLVKLRNAGS